MKVMVTLAETIDVDSIADLPELPDEPDKVRLARVKGELDPFMWIPADKQWLRYFLEPNEKV